MKTTPVIKPLLMASASAVLGLAIVGVLGDVPVQAAKFRVYGKFAPEAAINQNSPFLMLQNGSFEGTLDIDDRRYVPIYRRYVAGPSITAWKIQLLDSQGSPSEFLDSENGTDNFGTLVNYGDTSALLLKNYSNISNEISNVLPRPSDYFLIYKSKFLNLFLDQPNFIGKITPDSNFDFFYYTDIDSSISRSDYKIYVVDGYVEEVPEPLTIGGTVVAGAMGWWMKRRKKALQEV